MLDIRFEIPKGLVILRPVIVYGFLCDNCSSPCSKEMSFPITTFIARLPSMTFDTLTWCACGYERDSLQGYAGAPAVVLKNSHDYPMIHLSLAQAHKLIILVPILTYDFSLTGRF